MMAAQHWRAQAGAAIFKPAAGASVILLDTGVAIGFQKPRPARHDTENTRDGSFGKGGSGSKTLTPPPLPTKVSWRLDEIVSPNRSR